MGFNEFISKLFGNKATRDMKEIQPWVEKVKAVYPEISKLTNDELRAKTGTSESKSPAWKVFFEQESVSFDWMVRFACNRLKNWYSRKIFLLYSQSTLFLCSMILHR